MQATMVKVIVDAFRWLCDEELETVAAMLDEISLWKLMQTSHSVRSRLLSNEDMWLTRLTLLLNLFPGAAHLERGDDEQTAHAWYWRCRRALISASTMAQQHRSGMMPYM